MDEVVKERIQTTVNDNRVVLFMKGSRLFPQCGFSAQVVGILKELNVEFKDVNVLSDPDIRQGIKAYTNWPTIPQLYANGKFVGGCDIICDLYESGELKELLSS